MSSNQFVVQVVCNNCYKRNEPRNPFKVRTSDGVSVGTAEKFQTDPHWKDYTLFYEYFRGDNGAGLRSSHWTGWKGVTAPVIQICGRLDGVQLLASGKLGALGKAESAIGKRVAA